MTGVFLDTVGLIGVWNQSDQWHSAAKSAFSNIVRNHVPLMTTSYVLLECANEAARRPYRSKAIDLRRLLLANGGLIEPTPAEIDQAWADYGAGLANDAGVVDHVSFIVMRRLGLTEAFTNDRHFKAAGFNTLF